MRDDAPFLEAILQAPGDDAPLLIYADWLEEQGDLPRAELTRVQTELSRLEIDDPGRVELEIREDQLLSRHGADWRKRWLSSLAGVEWMRPSRGLIRHAMLTMTSQDKKPKVTLERAFDASPIDRLSLVGQQPQAVMTALTASPGMRRIRSIHLEQNRSPLALAVLTRSRHLANLNEVSALLEHYQALLDWEWLESPSCSVRSLTIVGQQDYSTDVTYTLQTLAESPAAHRLEKLALRRFRMTQESLDILANSESLSKIKHLDLIACQLTDASVDRLCLSTRLAPTHLNLSGGAIHDQGAEALALSALSKNLVYLDVSRNWIGDNGLRQLSRLPSLARLRITHNPITLSTSHLFAETSPNQRLFDLEFSADRELARLEALLEWPAVEQLQSLTMVDTPLGGNGMRILKRVLERGRLLRLNLRNNSLPSDHVKILTESPLCASLAQLDLSGNRISSALENELQARFGHRVVLDRPSDGWSSPDRP